MFEHKALQKMEDYFLDLNRRKSREVYFCRLNFYNEEIKGFLEKYYETARMSGVVIEGRIPNPTEQNLSYYEEIMGRNFQMNQLFIENSLKKWLPRLNDYQRKNVAESMTGLFLEMQNEGKNENMLKNAYIKFMCWMYYKFERILNQLGENRIPKILYEAEITNYELKLLQILSNAGCDILLLQYHGDENYQKLDPASKYSMAVEKILSCDKRNPFPEGFCIRSIRQEIEKNQNLQRLYGPLPQKQNATNIWLEGKILSDIRRPAASRGDREDFFYNAFCRISGVSDKVTYLNDIYQFYSGLKNENRKVVIVEKEIPLPDMEEISKINRKNYQTTEQMLSDLSKNMNYTSDRELQKLMMKGFLDVMLEESGRTSENRNRLMNKAVYLLCWLRRYQGQLFNGRKEEEISCFIYFGGCKNETECLFMKFLSKLPVDVLILAPDLNKKCQLEDSVLYEERNDISMDITVFPREQELKMGTAAYHAERDLDTILYQDSGIYRDFQFKKATSLSLNTMYEEIAILWNQELKFRPNFSITEENVNMPVIFSKISGVKDGNVAQYWKGIKELLTPDTLVVKNGPCMDPMKENPMKPYAVEFFKNGRLQKDKIKAHREYPFGFLKEEVQNYILDKMNLLIQQKTIKGTFENGMEYSIIATILNLEKEVLRLIQRFDFTKKNPKVIYINTKETMMSIEDSILMAFLNLVGFDILFFIPTGYQNIEKFYNKKMMEEHQIGEYLYDLSIPKLEAAPPGTHRSWRDRIFKRGS